MVYLRKSTSPHVLLARVNIPTLSKLDVCSLAQVSIPTLSKLAQEEVPTLSDPERRARRTSHSVGCSRCVACAH
eukprot:11159628-Lingulodinium_polyedra.AAC.1